MSNHGVLYSMCVCYSGKGLKSSGYLYGVAGRTSMGAGLFDPPTVQENLMKKKNPYRVVVRVRAFIVRLFGDASWVS